MVASEIVPRGECSGSMLTNKYDEGCPGKRYSPSERCMDSAGEERMRSLSGSNSDTSSRRCAPSPVVVAEVAHQ